MATEDEIAFKTEMLKLLLQVAWANDTLEPKERAFIEQLGKTWQIPEPTLEDLLAHLDQGKPLPLPNLALLRTQPDEVVRAAQSLIRADGVVDVEEVEFMRELLTILGT